MISRGLEIYKRAYEWRHSLLTCSGDLGPQFAGFPKGACGDAAMTLGAYLTRCGLGEFDYVLGTRIEHASDESSSHAWIEQDGLVVDITADQYPEVTWPVIVSSYSEWHLRLSGTPQHKARLDVFGEFVKEELDRIYKVILENVPVT